MSASTSMNIYQLILTIVGMDGQLNLIVDKFCSLIYRQPGNFNQIVSKLSINFTRSFSKVSGLLKIHLPFIVSFVNVIPSLEPEDIVIVLIVICSVVIDPGIQPE